MYYGELSSKALWRVSITPVSITLTNPNSSLVFWSLIGNLYTDNAGQNPVSLNTKYSGTTFYYNGAETKPTGNYLYDYGRGRPVSSFRSDCATCTKDFLTQRYNDGNLTAIFGTSGYCWSVTQNPNSGYYRLSLSSGVWYSSGTVYDYFRCNSANF